LNVSTRGQRSQGSRILVLVSLIVIALATMALARPMVTDIEAQEPADECVCDTFTPGFFFNQGENNQGTAFAEASLSGAPIAVAGITFDSVQDVQDSAAPGSLLRHYLALVLSVRMADSNGCDLTSLIYVDAGSEFNGMTVADILATAGAALNAGEDKEENPELHAVIDAINNNHGAQDGVLACPAVETGTPAGATPPDDEETPPDDEETPPDDEETPPDDEETPPDDEETPPDDEETPPDDEETPAGETATATAPSREDTAGGTPAGAAGAGAVPNTATQPWTDVPGTVLGLLLMASLGGLLYARLAHDPTRRR
jgi:hypothetical protein